MIDKTLRRKIISCWNYGWYVNNIAHICETDIDTVTSVLKDKGVKDIR